MLALVGRGEITPVPSLRTQDSTHVTLGDNIVFSPLAARLLSELSHHVAMLSTSLGFTRTRVLSMVAGGHERAALQAAAKCRVFGGRGVFQVTEKRRDERTSAPLLRMPIFTMWEAFTFHDEHDQWVSVANAARAWLGHVTFSAVHPATSENTLMPKEPAQEYALFDRAGEERYVRSLRGEFVNSALLNPDRKGITEGFYGIELGNSYALGESQDGFAAAHSIGLDRLVGAMLMRRPANLLDWTEEPVRIRGLYLQSRLEAQEHEQLVRAPGLAVLATGEEESRVFDALEGRRSSAGPLNRNDVDVDALP